MLEQFIEDWENRGKDTNVTTNAEKIRAMSDEELAVFVDCRSLSDVICPGDEIGGCFGCTAVADWLKQPWGGK